MQCLSGENFNILLRRQTDTALQSHSVMYEILGKGAPSKKDSNYDFSDADYNYW
jgi:hypothetical protein